MELGTLESEYVDVYYNSSFEEAYNEYLKSLEEQYIKEYMDEGYTEEQARNMLSNI